MRENSAKVGSRAESSGKLTHKQNSHQQYVAGVAGGTGELTGNVAFDLDRFITAKSVDLAAYQNQAYGDRYRRRIAEVHAAEQAVGRGTRVLEEAVARGLYKLMAYKDEYEVARLHSTPAFKKKLAAQFEGNYSIAFNLFLRWRCK